MIASLAMYDMAPLRPATARLWGLIRDRLRAEGLPAPEALTEGPAAYWPAWEAPDLVLSQTCGLPYRSRLKERVTLVGTFDYGVEGCAPGHYRSVLVVGRTDPRSRIEDFAGAPLAYNEALSQSGWAAPQTHAAGLGFAFAPGPQTGSHRASLLAVAEGRAAVAALDAVTWRHLQRWEPAAARVRVLAETAPTPGLPCIAGPAADGPRSLAAAAAAIAALAPADRDLLGLRGIVALPQAAYLAVPTPAGPDRIAQPA
jgi:ABC-type phosphate/phosphonate transport system substrate-binding protein